MTKTLNAEQEHNKTGANSGKKKNNNNNNNLSTIIPLIYYKPRPEGCHSNSEVLLENMDMLLYGHTFSAQDP